MGVTDDLPAQARDPICGAMIRTADAVGRRTRDDATFYFCSRECRDRFDRLYAGVADRADRHLRLRWVELPLVELDARHAAPRLREELGRVSGVRHVAVNGSERLAVVGYDPAAVELPTIVACARQAGFAVRTVTTLLAIRELRCPVCADLVERALRSTPGVVRAAADPAAAQARVEYVDGLVDPIALAEAVEETGLRGEVASHRWSPRGPVHVTVVGRPAMA